MLNGAAVMDAAMLLIAGNETCPQPQTAEHLAAVEIMKLKHLIILQNKIDLVNKESATSQSEDIKAFLKGTCAETAPIIPISAQLKYNIDVICEYISHHTLPASSSSAHSTSTSQAARLKLLKVALLVALYCKVF